MTRNRILTDIDRNIAGDINARTEESYNHIVRNLGQTMVSPLSPVTFPRKDLGGVFVASGKYGGFECEEGRQMVIASPGAVFSGQVVVKGTLILSSCIFNMLENNTVITIEPSGRLILNQCHIIKADNKHSAASTFISIKTGGFASVSNCFFHGLQSDLGSIVNNEDPLNPGRAAVLGCVNLTDIVTTPYINVAYIQDVP